MKRRDRSINQDNAHPKRAQQVSLPGISDPIDPIHAKAYMAEGHKLSENQNYVEAEKCFRKAVQINPELPIAHNNLGFVRQAQGDLEAAIACYRTALELDPRFTLATGNLVKALVMRERHDEALALIEKRLATAPGDPQALDIAVDIALAAGRLELAAAYAGRHAVVRGASRFYPRPRLHDPRIIPSSAPELTVSKLRHDIEQLRYLRERGVLTADFSSIIAEYERLLEDIAPFGNDGRHPLSAEDARLIGHVYGRLLHVRPTPRLARAISDTWDPVAVENQYLTKPPGVVVVDDFLTPEALRSLRAFCLESTVWSINRYTNGYLGAFFREGFSCPLLLQIAEELQRFLPRVIGKRPLLHLWGYKYDSTMSGIATHADFAAVNVNFWITPDDANLDPESGGLIVHDLEAPLNWDFLTYNDDRFTMQALLKQKGARTINVPYRQNRVVIFNSDLFHATAPFNFRPGYENRRLNITMLYGRREHAKEAR